MDSFLSGVFSQGFSTIVYALTEIWPYLMTIGVLYLFWRVGKGIFKT